MLLVHLSLHLLSLIIQCSSKKFDCIVGTDFEDIQNPFSGETVSCPPDFVAVYDTIKGAEILGNNEHLQKGLDWARQYYPQLYMKLLD